MTHCLTGQNKTWTLYSELDHGLDSEFNNGHAKIQKSHAYIHVAMIRKVSMLLIGSTSPLAAGFVTKSTILTRK